MKAEDGNKMNKDNISFFMGEKNETFSKCILGQNYLNLLSISAFPMGKENEIFEKYFSGQSYLNLLSKDQVIIKNVTFEPGCRNNWHIHHAKSGGGEILLVTAGSGYYQEWGKPVRELSTGDVVNIPAGVKHWHGAAVDSWFAHLEVVVPGDEECTEWLEAVCYEKYHKQVTVLADEDSGDKENVQ